MTKIWKVIGIVVAIAIVFAALCILVGSITGGSVARLLDVFGGHYDIGAIRAFAEDAIQKLLGILPL